MDGSLETKLFAPGYGELSTGSGANLEAVALAVPTDALPGPMPGQLSTLWAEAGRIFDAAEEGDWTAALAALETMAAAWTAFRAGGGVPPMLASQLNTALAALVTAVHARQGAAARQRSIEVARASLDLQLRHRRPTEIDLAQLDLWCRQILVDVGADDIEGILGDIATLGWIRDRVAHVLKRVDLRRVSARLQQLRRAADAEDLEELAEVASSLREILARID